MSKNQSEIKCAKWCGHGCTRKEYETATLEASKLAKLLGKGWRPHVWENLGWHWSSINGGVKVHPNIDYRSSGKVRNYTCFVGKDGHDGGRWTGTGRTPRSAVANALVAVKKEMAILQAAVECTRSAIS